ncbi:MAG TPA: tRNA glutamyl-Q(34) synthetase GluQRS [Nitrosomonas nitrosa]|uniref:Glutamyl-Q tRNA(Asp) synthetase n=1 Tax=Nitrosomonas nitrosa TaxID=52442 RepID=A0A8H8Z285_9PROT|nr:tRNA glutamyl-Q(34) synthetase GluQRS [Nitrosomonas nitrosa]CAE6512686.1 Glutamyl-Q tRNA(Asp) synthetase [Nitrosomonas nitrosa]HNP51988.1 tRNA glutamyl-Q(34) synthetase GluQRS [Nitrosomonas nitrosa]
MKQQSTGISTYRGRFAPSPTGALHLGSLVTAIASYLEARTRGGEWLVRIEDLDVVRTLPGAAQQIMQTLELLGMSWDGEIIYQSQRQAAYQAALLRLENEGFMYPCTCSRKEIADTALIGVDGPIYPGSCRAGRSIALSDRPSAWRIRTDNRLIHFEDSVQGSICQRVENEIGDFVLRRADGIYSYQLAVVVDDAWQGITHVVRGADLLHSTSRQIYLQKLLGVETPCYLHVPVVVNEQGEKLSKQTRAEPINLTNPLPQLVAALRFLGQNPPEELSKSDLSTFWEWALANWCVGEIPRRSHVFLKEP